MAFVQNFPFFCIILTLFSGSVCAIVKGKTAKIINTVLISLVGIMNACVLAFVIKTRESYTFMMGHFPAPWGNEIRVGVLEAFMALFFCVIMLLSMDVEKHNLYYVLINLLLSSLIALVYTNDIFTAYVFVEINTISACGLIMIRQNGRTIEAAVRYMIMSLLGSGLLLMGIEAVASSGEYNVPLLIAIAFMSIGLAIKSALFPFHAWLPDAYGYSTVSSAAILSSLVSKGYIFLLIKIIYRVVGFDLFKESQIINVLFVFGLCGMIFGSVSAIRENDIRRMIAFSSVAQIGYIYMGIGMGTDVGMAASVFHILSHAATKSLLFIAAIGLTDVSDGSRQFIKLTGSAYRNRIAGFTFAVGALSMVGIPLFPGFVSKLLFAQAATANSGKMLPVLICLGISTILNAIYFMKTVLRIYTPIDEETEIEYNATKVSLKNQPVYAITCVLFIVVNLILGVSSAPIMTLIEHGLSMFS